MTYLVISTAFCVSGLLILHWLHNQHHLDIVVEPVAPPFITPLISICIPARNEERNLRACVEAALNQDYPNLEFIVLDDVSSDATPRIAAELAARDSRLRLISGSDLPLGWAGKPHALYQAATDARGEWLCFIDADTILSTNAISSCHAKAIETNADLFTIMTFQVLGSFWEKTVMPLVMTALSVGFSPRRVNDPNRKDAIANGQFILIKRVVYNSIGGHAAVKNRIVEDQAISELVKGNGYRLIVADGMSVARTRMYTSLPEIWEGWTKNIYLGLRDHTPLLVLGLVGAFLAIFAAVVLPAWSLLAILWLAKGGDWPALATFTESLIVWGMLIFHRATIAARLRFSRWYSLTTPLGAGIFGAMMFASAWKVITKQGVSWKGRVYGQS